MLSPDNKRGTLSNAIVDAAQQVYTIFKVSGIYSYGAFIAGQVAFVYQPAGAVVNTEVVIAGFFEGYHHYAIVWVGVYHHPMFYRCHGQY